jgi:hypothetical protein
MHAAPLYNRTTVTRGLIIAPEKSAGARTTSPRRLRRDGFVAAIAIT